MNESWQDHATRIVLRHVNKNLEQSGVTEKATKKDILLLFSSKIDHSWQGIFVTTVVKNVMYRVVYYGDRKKTFVKAFTETADFMIRDDEF